MSNRQTRKESQPADEEADAKSGKAPKSYYYDDSTGYETYDAEEDADKDGAGEGDPHRTES
jgi:hypothetical protein